MDHEGKEYPRNHWIRSDDAPRALDAYLEQQGKAYSRVKNDFVTELLGNLSGKRFLDYGCGGGMFTVYAARQGAAEVVGVDALESVLNTARYFAAREGVLSACSFIRSDSFPKTLTPRFDVVLMKDVIEHVPEDGDLLRRAAAALVPGGVLVLSTQNSLSLNFLIQGTYRRHVLGEKEWFGWDETHLRFYTPISLSSALRGAGFEPVAWRSAYIIPYRLPRLPGSKRQFLRIDALSWIDRALGGMFPYNRLGWNIIVKAQSSELVKQRVPLWPLVAEGASEFPLAPGAEHA